jgi:hypothetical protein
MTEDRKTAPVHALRRSIGGVLLVGLIAGILPLALATPAFAARSKTIKITDASVVEGNSGSQSMSFTVSWSGAKGGGTVQVAYATANGTATAGSDYTAKSGTLSLSNGGCHCATISVPILGDTMFEGTETFTVNLSNPVNATIADAQGVGTIYDNEGPPAFVVGDTSADESAGKVTFTVVLTSSTGGTQTVDYATADGTAVAGSDYTAKSGTLSFTGGQTSKTIDVTVADDALNEADETFNLVLSNGTVTIDDTTGVATILDNDAEPTVSVSDATAAENAGPLAFTISLSAVSGQEVDVDYTTTDGTAVAGDDYTATSGTAVIPAGQTSVEIDVPVSDDAVHESDETLTLDLSLPYNSSIADAQGLGTITNDDAVPEASIGDVSLAEGNTGTTPATFDVTLNHPADTTLTVDWATADGTAVAGSDYASGSGTASFAPGETAKQISVDVVGDDLEEADETFTVTLSNPSGTTIGTGTGTATITNDDVAPVVSIGDVSIAEGNTGLTPATFDVTLDHPLSTTVTVDWATADGTAAAVTDYVTGNGTVSFAPGETAKQVSVNVVGDATKEADETFTVALSNPSGATIGAGTGTATITNDDGAPTTLTLKTRKTKTRVLASGVLEPAASALSIAVSLQKKVGKTWTLVKTRVVGVGTLGDRDTDGIPDATYRTWFKRPARGTYRVRSIFAGTPDLLASTTTVTFKL